MSATTLNPDAPLFIPAALLQVEDFSPMWWDLVTTTAWFRDHWSSEHSRLDDMSEVLDDDAALLLLPDDDDLFAVVDDDEDGRRSPPAVLKRPPAPLNTGAVLKALNLTSPKGGFREKSTWHAEKPVKHAASPRGGAPRVIHQPR